MRSGSLSPIFIIWNTGIKGDTVIVSPGKMQIAVHFVLNNIEIKIVLACHGTYIRWSLRACCLRVKEISIF